MKIVVPVILMGGISVLVLVIVGFWKGIRLSSWSSVALIMILLPQAQALYSCKDWFYLALGLGSSFLGVILLCVDSYKAGTKNKDKVASGND